MDGTNKNTSPDSVEELKLLLAERRHHDALKAWKGVQPTHPRFEGARLLLAESLLSARPDIALTLLRAAVAYNPRSYKAARLLAHAYRLTATRKI